MQSGHSFHHMEVGRSVFVQVLDSLDACVGLLDVNGAIVALNATTLATADLDRAQVVGQPFAEMPCWSWSEQVQAEVRRQIAAAADGRTQRSDIKICLGQNRYVDFDCSLKPVVDDLGRVTHLLWSGTDVTARARSTENAAAIPGVLPDVEGLKDGRAEAPVVAGEERLRRQLEELETIYRQAPVGLALFDRDFRYLRINERLAEINGLPVEAHIGRRLQDIVPDVAGSTIPILRRVFETGEPIHNVEIEGETAREPGVRRFWTEEAYPLKNEGGAVWAVGLIVRDVTDCRRAEEQRGLLLAELEHRVKNTLASVMSIAAHTLRDGRDLAAARKIFIGRLHALSHAHDLLAAGNWQSADLAQVVRRSLDPYAAGDGTRWSLDGPTVFLRPRAAVTLGMILHELATNAAKYGSLSTPEGSLEVTWSSETLPASESMLHLVWSEKEGPPVTPPSRTGFGRTLIERGLKHDLGGEARLEFNPDGLICTLMLPLDRTVASFSPS